MLQEIHVTDVVPGRVGGQWQPLVGYVRAQRLSASSGGISASSLKRRVGRWCSRDIRGGLAQVASSRYWELLLKAWLDGRLWTHYRQRRGLWRGGRGVVSAVGARDAAGCARDRGQLVAVNGSAKVLGSWATSERMLTSPTSALHCLALGISLFLIISISRRA